MEIEEKLNPSNLSVAISSVAPRADAIASDDELDKKYLRREQKKSFARREREERWDLIKPLVDGPDAVLLFDPQLRQEAVAKRALVVATLPDQLRRLKRKIQDWLNQYWAGGSTRGALTPFTSTCGARGKEKQSARKLGRRNRPTRSGKRGNEGFIVTDYDKDIIRYSWRNYYTRGTTERKACRLMWREFYSTWLTDDYGRLRNVLLRPEDRPTPAQFHYWGQKQSPDQAAWRKQLAATAALRIDRALTGSANDGIVNIGQRGSIDSTSIDMDLVSTLCRLDRIGSAYRILVIDAMYGYIAGFYLGLLPPSAETVKLAILHAMTPKGAWLKWLGLDHHDIANWIPIHFQSFIADNTDARADRVFVALDDIGSGSLHIPVARSDLNSPVEVGHHRLHRSVDHNLLGTTFGQMQTERGDVSAPDRARHTIIEAIRETARGVYAENTTPLDIEPTEEMREELIANGIPITRASLTALRIRQGRMARSLMNIDEARAHMMPITRGTFTKHGVLLLRPDTGNCRKFIKSVRYLSKHPVILNKFREAANQRKSRDIKMYDDEFRYDPYNLTEIHFRHPHTGEMIALSGISADRELLGDCSYADILLRQDRYDLERPENLDAQERIRSNLELEQEATKRKAEAEYAAELDALDKPPSKAALVANKSENRQREKNLFPLGMPTPAFDVTDSDDQPDQEDNEVGNAGSPNPIQAAEGPRPRPSSPARKPITTSKPSPLSIFSQVVINQLH